MSTTQFDSNREGDINFAEDQRLHKRVYFDIQAWSMFDQEPKTRIRTLNISESGIGVLSPILVLPKSQGFIKLAMPVAQQPEELFEVKAEVIHAEQVNNTELFQMGLHFIEPDAHLVNMIRSMVE